MATALHLNLRAQVKFGHLAPWQALQSATLKPARMYNVANDLGTVERGKLADLVFINGDPLTDITQLANVAAVMKGGRYYSNAEILAPFIAPTPAAPPAAAVAPQHRFEAPLAHPGDAPWWHDMCEMVDGCQQRDHERAPHMRPHPSPAARAPLYRTSVPVLGPTPRCYP